MPRIENHQLCLSRGQIVFGFNLLPLRSGVQRLQGRRSRRLSAPLLTGKLPAQRTAMETAYLL